MTIFFVNIAQFFIYPNIHISERFVRIKHISSKSIFLNWSILLRKFEGL